jgi:hypothetical protein
MLGDLDSGADIAHHTERLLRAAGANERLPTPVEDIVAAAKLKEAKESWLSEPALRGVPEYLARKIRRLRGKAHAALDRKTHEIHISPTIDHDGQRRFKALHEVTHDILPWQDDVAYADDGMTLSWSTHVKFEQEANQGSAELLFQRDLFQRIGVPPVLWTPERLGPSAQAGRMWCSCHAVVPRTRRSSVVRRLSWSVRAAGRSTRSRRISGSAVSRCRHGSNALRSTLVASRA